MHFAVIDLGGSFIKSAVADVTTGLLHHLQKTPFPSFLDGSTHGAREVDLSLISDAFQGHLQRLLEHEPRCEGILISSQMHGFALVDSSGRPVGPFVSWQDQRGLFPAGSASFDEFRARVPRGALQRIGNEIGVGHASSVLFSLARSGELPSGGCSPVPLPVAILASLTGAEPSADATLAASFGVWNVREGVWDSELISTLGLSSLNWPRITRAPEVVARYHHHGRAIPVFSPVGDQQAALAGALLSEEELSVNIGTGSQVTALSHSFRYGDFKVRPYLDHRFLETVTHIPAGRALNLLVRLIGGSDPQEARRTWDRVDAELPEHTDLEVDLAFFPSAFGHRGRIGNIGEENLTLGHLLLGAFNNMASNYATAADRIDPERARSTILYSGGLAHRSPRLRRIVNEQLGRQSRLSSSAEETLVGLACLARVAAGLDPTLASATESLRTRLTG